MIILDWWNKKSKEEKDIYRKKWYYKPFHSVYMYIHEMFGSAGRIESYVFFPIKAYLRTHKVSRFYDDYKIIETLKNKHKGKRCFILATGPSLQISDIEQLENEYTFGLNTFYKLYDKTDFRPTYYISLEPEADLVFKKIGEFNPDEYAKEAAFLNYTAIKRNHYKKVIYLPVCYQNHYYSVLKEHFDYFRNMKATTDVLYGIYDKYNLTPAVIDLAMYMGFSEIYLLGADCNYSGGRTHATGAELPEDTVEEETARRYFKAMIAGYTFLKSDSEKRGVHICNATRGGMLEVFDRVKFDDLISGESK